MNPRTSGTALSTHAYGTRATGRSCSRQSRTMRDSLNCARTGSRSSAPESEHHCHSKKPMAAAPACGPSRRPSGRNDSAASGLTRYVIHKASPAKCHGGAGIIEEVPDGDNGKEYPCRLLRRDMVMNSHHNTTHVQSAFGVIQGNPKEGIVDLGPGYLDPVLIPTGLIAQWSAGAVDHWGPHALAYGANAGPWELRAKFAAR